MVNNRDRQQNSPHPQEQRYARTHLNTQALKSQGLAREQKECSGGENTITPLLGHRLTERSSIGLAPEIPEDLYMLIKKVRTPYTIASIFHMTTDNS